MLFSLLLLTAPPTPTPAPRPTFVVILRDDATRYTATEDPRGKRLVVLTGPDGRKTSAASGDIDTEATRLANLPPAKEVESGPKTLGNAPPTPRSVTEMSKEQKAKGAKGSLSINPGAPPATTPKSPAAAEGAREGSERPRVVVDSATVSLIDSDGAVTVTGQVTNRGPGPACWVRIFVKVYSTEERVLGTRDVSLGYTRIPQKEQASYRAVVSLPLGTRNEVRGDGYVTKQNDGSRGPSLGRVEARIEEAQPCS